MNFSGYDLCYYNFFCRFWWLKIEACGEAGDWMELDRHCKSQKSPIGYEVSISIRETSLRKKLKKKQTTAPTQKTIKKKLVYAKVLHLH